MKAGGYPDDTPPASLCEVRDTLAEMIEIEEIDECDLDRWLAVHNAVRPRDPLTPDMVIDWRNQSGSMIWLIASIEGTEAGAGIKAFPRPRSMT